MFKLIVYPYLVKFHSPSEVSVLPQFGYSLILDLDFLEANKAQSDFANCIGTFFSNLSAIDLSTSHQCRIASSVCTLPAILPPFSEAINYSRPKIYLRPQCYRLKPD